MADVEYFLKLSRIQGESQHPKHPDEIEVRSWSWGLTSTKGIGSGTGHVGTARPTFQDLAIVKGVDRSSPKLAEACVNGTHLQEAVLSASRPGGSKLLQDFLVLRLSDVMISSFVEVADEGMSFPSCSFSLNFSRIVYSYTMQMADGTADAPVTWAWDFKASRPP
jgi:type VI secretion system secreted protein Hcp